MESLHLRQAMSRPPTSAFAWTLTTSPKTLLSQIQRAISSLRFWTTILLSAPQSMRSSLTSGWTILARSQDCYQPQPWLAHPRPLISGNSCHRMAVLKKMGSIKPFPDWQTLRVKLCWMGLEVFLDVSRQILESPVNVHQWLPLQTERLKRWRRHNKRKSGSKSG